MRIYISGKITGLTRDRAKELFEAAEKRLPEFYTEFHKNISQTITAVNPFKVDHSKAYAMEDANKKASHISALQPYTELEIWAQFMKEDIGALLGCAGVHMLSNWVHSQGARIEHAIAKEMGLIITYEQ